MLQLFYTNYKYTIQQNTSYFWNFQYEAHDNGIPYIREVVCEHKPAQCLRKSSPTSPGQQALRHSVLLSTQTAVSSVAVSSKVVKHTHSPAQPAQSSKELLSYIYTPCTPLGKMPSATEYSQWPVGRTKLPFIKHNWTVVQLCFHSKNFNIPT